MSVKKMQNNIVIPNPKELERIKKQISKDGAKKLHVISDFDGTIIKSFVDGQRIPSLISVLRDENYLTPDYREKAHALYNKYHSIEINHNIPLKEKKKAMYEWWTTHFKLLIKCGLNKRDLERVVESSRIQLREGVIEFFDFLYKKGIPNIIMSSSGLGDAILILLKKKGILFDNIYVITNLYEWDKNGNAIGVKEPIIHSMNKDETSIRDYPVFKIIKNRRNVLLLGDSLGDPAMIEGFDYDNLLKIGFLNENVEENLEKYKQNFDVVLLNDASMNYINKLLKEMIG